MTSSAAKKTYELSTSFKKQTSTKEIKSVAKKYDLGTQALRKAFPKPDDSIRPPESTPASPAALPLTEVEESKRRVRKGAAGRGRPSTILARRLMQRIGDTGKRVLG